MLSGKPSLRRIQCCMQWRDLVGCPGDVDSPCMEADEKLDCWKLEEQFLEVIMQREGLEEDEAHELFECHAFPDEESGRDLFLQGLIVAAIAFVLKGCIEILFEVSNEPPMREAWLSWQGPRKWIFGTMNWRWRDPDARAAAPPALRHISRLKYNPWEVFYGILFGTAGCVWDAFREEWGPKHGEGHHGGGGGEDGEHQHRAHHQHMPAARRRSSSVVRRTRSQHARASSGHDAHPHAAATAEDERPGSGEAEQPCGAAPPPPPSPGRELLATYSLAHVGRVGSLLRGKSLAEIAEAEEEAEEALEENLKAAEEQARPAGLATTSACVFETVLAFATLRLTYVAD